MKMKIQKKTITYTDAELDIMGATLLSVREAEKLSLRLRHYNYWWWLRSPGYQSYYAASVLYDGTVGHDGVSVYDDTHGVRPALKIRNLELPNLEIGDIFMFGDKEFEVISENLAFCTTDIGTHRFDESSNNYEKSEIKQYVNSWFEKSKTINNLNKIKDMCKEIEAVYKDVEQRKNQLNEIMRLFNNMNEVE